MVFRLSGSKGSLVDEGHLVEETPQADATQGTLSDNLSRILPFLFGKGGIDAMRCRDRRCSAPGTWEPYSVMIVGENYVDGL